MSKLFVIGSGFDSAHNIPAAYKYFKQYLMEKYDDSHLTDIKVHVRQKYITGMQVIETINAKEFMVQAISYASEDGEWRDFESALGHLDFTSLFEEEKEDPFACERNREVASNIENCLEEIPAIFAEWINAMPAVGKKHDSFADMLKSDDLVINFNYTDTIERLYRFNNVFHIHGRKNGNIIVGHGEKFPDIENCPSTVVFVYQLHNDLMKKVQKVIKSEPTQEFLDSIGNDITEVISYGFSYSDVDMPYMKEIVQRLHSENVTWKFNDFSSPDTIEIYKEKLKNNGYKGKFSTFHDE